MKKKIYKYLYWSVLWHSKNCLDGIKEYIVQENQLPVLFHTKREAKEYIKRRFGYIATRKDLRTEPHGWRMPKAIGIILMINKL